MHDFANSAVRPSYHKRKEEKNEQDDSLVTGRMSNNTIVHFPGGEDLIGTLAEVHLDECHGFYYTGTIENKR